MKGMFASVVFSLLVLSGYASASNTLVLSSELMLRYPTPELISHSTNTLIIKYEDWYFTHQVVDSSSFVPKVDLEGVEALFIRSIFLSEHRERLPDWLQVLAEDLQLAYGGEQGAIIQRDSPGEEVLGSYNSETLTGHLFVFDQAAIHRIVVQGPKDRFEEVLERIKERSHGRE